MPNLVLQEDPAKQIASGYSPLLQHNVRVSLLLMSLTVCLYDYGCSSDVFCPPSSAVVLNLQ